MLSVLEKKKAIFSVVSYKENENHTKERNQSQKGSVVCMRVGQKLQGRRKGNDREQIQSNSTQDTKRERNTWTASGIQQHKRPWGQMAARTQKKLGGYYEDASHIILLTKTRDKK